MDAKHYEHQLGAFAILEDEHVVISTRDSFVTLDFHLCSLIGEELMDLFDFILSLAETKSMVQDAHEFAGELGEGEMSMIIEGDEHVRSFFNSLINGKEDQTHTEESYTMFPRGNLIYMFDPTGPFFVDLYINGFKDLKPSDFIAECKRVLKEILN